MLHSNSRIVFFALGYTVKIYENVQEFQHNLVVENREKVLLDESV